ncbi:hypothetical protein Tco_1274605 [Tanacetum coccineum]
MGHYSWDVIGGTSLWWDTRGGTTKVGHQRQFSFGVFNGKGTQPKRDVLIGFTTSCYVTNFPVLYRPRWLFLPCKQYGHVVDFTIPVKKIKVIKATNEFEVDGRIAWVEVEGVPFKLWTNNTFTRIAEKQVIVSEEDFKNHYRAGSLQVSEFHRTGGSMVGLLEDCDKKVGQIRIWNKSNSGTRKNDQLRLKKQLEEIDLDIDRGIGNEELVNSRLAILHQIQKGLDNLEIEGNGSKG